MNLFRCNPDSPISSPADFRELYERDRLSVFRYIYGLTGGLQADAEDLTAETFLRAWNARHRFVGDRTSATGWLIRIAKRLVIDEYRRKLQASRNHHSAPEAGSSPEQDAIAGEQKQFLGRVLSELTEEQREIVTLRYLLGRRVTDIARHLGASENNISVILHRSLSRLREKWREEESENRFVTFIQKETSYEPHA